MSFSVIAVAVLLAVGVAIWFFFSTGEEEPSVAQAETGTFRCKVCGTVSKSFLDAHNHATAEHELSGHHLDESIERG